MSENDKLDDIEFISEIMEARESIDEAHDEVDELRRIIGENTGTLYSLC
jgi:hypothetical protein